MLRWKIVVTILICALAQVTLPGRIPGYQWVRVEWTLLAVIYFSLRRDWHLTMWVGILGGLAIDLLSGGRLGVFALSYMTAATVLGFYHRWLHQGTLFAAFVLTFLISLFVSTANFFILQFFGSYPAYWSCLGRNLLPAAAINAVFAVPFFAIIPRILQRSLNRL